MIFNDKKSVKEIVFEETDTDMEKRMLEQGLAFIMNTIQRIREAADESSKKK